MTKLLRAALVVASLLTLSFTAQADDTDPQPQPQPASHYPHLYGSFCSVASYSGVWGFVFNADADVQAKCQYLESLIGGIYTRNGGYYLIQGWNEAVAQCGPLRSYFRERGALALQRAYEYARIINGTHCTFEVYFRR
jgi:hypothetical protein